jgi:hypothetical protein
MANRNDLAFPFVVNGDTIREDTHQGLTKRELFAALALQGILANGEMSPGYGPLEQVADAVDYANKLCSELKRTS